MVMCIFVIISIYSLKKENQFDKLSYSSYGVVGVLDKKVLFVEFSSFGNEPFIMISHSN